jgi:hypothetical protein
MIVGLPLALVAWWWIDSAVTCSEQDEYSLRGVCLMRIKARAEANDRWAQWFYGAYLMERGRQPEGYEWVRKSVASRTKGIELMELPGMCGKAPGFDTQSIESKLQSVARQSPDAHLLLIQLYMLSRCAPFDLQKVSQEIPLLPQCAALTLRDFLDKADSAKLPVSRDTAQAISANLALCKKDLGTPQGGPVLVASEIIRPNEEDIAEVERRIAPLLAPRAQ